MKGWEDITRMFNHGSTGARKIKRKEKKKEKRKKKKNKKKTRNQKETESTNGKRGGVEQEGERQWRGTIPLKPPSTVY
jgi:hypothetical protein